MPTRPAHSFLNSGMSKTQKTSCKERPILLKRYTHANWADRCLLLVWIPLIHSDMCTWLCWCVDMHARMNARVYWCALVHGSPRSQVCVCVSMRLRMIECACMYACTLSCIPLSLCIYVIACMYECMLYMYASVFVRMGAWAREVHPLACSCLSVHVSVRSSLYEWVIMYECVICDCMRVCMLSCVIVFIWASICVCSCARVSKCLRAVAFQCIYACAYRKTRYRKTRY